MSRVFLVGALAGFLSLSAHAQDELPKDAPPAPPPKAGAEQPPAALPGAEPQAPAEPQEPEALPPGTMVDQPWAVLQALDKITARIRRLPIKVGETATFGTLSIQVDACRKAPPEDPPESAAFLKITDKRPEKAQTVFDGWMFASSPAVSAMDHPIYDIWVVDCAADATASTGPAETH
jgi:hypothetical protein